LSRIGARLGLLLILCIVGAMAFLYVRWVQRERRFNDLITEVSARYSVDKFLIKAVIRRESKFDPFALGDAGEFGLMQVTGDAGQEWAWATGQKGFEKDWLWNPKLNLEAGTWYLGQGLRRWSKRDDPVVFALAHYNGGPGNVRRWVGTNDTMTAEEFLSVMDRPSVREYIKTVTSYYGSYKRRGEL
jgi:soluble lytic murein transglycosylase